MKFKRRKKLEDGNLNITPLIDVVFLLLIFFMLSSSFILQPGIVIDLPSAVKTEVIPKQSAIITVTENEHIYLNDKISSLEKLSEQLSSFPKDSVIIQADGEVALGVVVSVWDICRSLGIEKLNIATRQKKFS